MKKHLPLTGLAATLCLLLSGCAPLERIDKIDNQVSRDENQADKHMHALKQGSVVRDLTSQWINPYPLNAQPGAIVCCLLALWPSIVLGASHWRKSVLLSVSVVVCLWW